MDYAVSRARLKNYFSTVTYIDDRFDHCIIDEPLDFGDEETVDTPPLPILGLATPPIATGEIAPIPHADEKDMEINLSTILAALNDEKYAGIRFTPVLFKDNLAKEILVKKIQESPLTLIDWNLGEKEKAFDFINLLFETTKQLKVIVVYAQKVFHEALHALYPHLKNSNATFCKALLEVKYTQIKDACTLAIKDSTSWVELLKIFSSILDDASTIIVEQRVNSLLAPYSKLEIPTELTEEIDKHKEHVQRDISQQVSIERECFFSEVFPVLVQILVSSPDILFAGAELVQNLKYHYYDDTDLNTILAAGKELKKAEKETYLRNKFHYGDILIRNRKGSATEYLLCISPPCDVCRPGKVKLNICFINGLEVPEAELTVKRKENVHISVLPINNGCKTDLKYVAWRLFDIVKFDLGKKEDYESICSYSRPFMMSEQYSRQIGNLFTSYFSRAGVDELFMKSAQNLRALFK